jgi:Holliday junction resolvase
VSHGFNRRLHSLGKGLKEGGKPSVPLVPVVAAANRVKLALEMKLGEESGELPVCREQTLLLSAGQKKYGADSGFAVRTKTKGSLSRRARLPTGPKIEL